MTDMYLRSIYEFGKDSLDYLDTFLKGSKYKNILLIYGGKTIKNNGLYTNIKNIVSKNKLNFFEYGGIQPNPIDTEVNKAAEYGIKSNIDLVIAAGGGSVIDTAKMVCLLINNPQIRKIQNYFENRSLATNQAVNLVAIPTTAGTASENNNGAVINLTETNEKRGIHNVSCTPILCIENPEFLKTASNWQLASAMFDCFTHLFEQYYGPKTFDWTKEYLFANLRVVYKNSIKLLDDHNNYEALSNIMWTTTMSFNKLSSFNSVGDWNIHYLEHAISAKWNVTHGAGLALIMPKYIKYRCDTDKSYRQKTLVLAKEVFSLNSTDELFNLINEWIKRMGLPARWTDFKEITTRPTKDEINTLIKHYNTQQGRSIPLDDKAVETIYNSIK